MCFALVCNDAIVDYVAWSYHRGTQSNLRKAAVSAGMWSDISGYCSRSIREGESIGRDKDSSDTNTPFDWTYSGGLYAQYITPTAQIWSILLCLSLMRCYLIQIPSLLYPNERRTFVEIFRPDGS